MMSLHMLFPRIIIEVSDCMWIHHGWEQNAMIDSHFGAGTDWIVPKIQVPGWQINEMTVAQRITI